MIGDNTSSAELIESLAKVVEPAEILEHLGRLAARADQETHAELADAARALTEKLRNAPEPAVCGQYLTAGLGALRACVERDEDSQTMNDIADDPELLQDFILESREHLTKVEQNLLKLEKNPDESEAIHATFRSFHTIKGLAGFLGFAAIQEVAHETETLLDLARSSVIPVTPLIIDVVLRSADYLKDSLDKIENKERVKVKGPVDLLQALQAAAGAKPTQPDAPPIEPAKATADLKSASAKKTRGKKKPKGEAAAAQSESTIVKPDTAPLKIDALVEPRMGATPAKATAPQAPAEVKAGPAVSGALKVDADKIEHLIDMVGELVIAQSMVRQNPALAALGDTILARSLAQLTRVTTEVQKTAMSMRMAPVSGLFQKVERLVRDVARKSGKVVDLKVNGDNAEMDRKILDGLSEPLVHMVRNAVDHGLEQPRERVEAGKDPTGTIRLRAERESGNIVIEISDDGKGLDPEKIRRKAIDRGLISQHARLSADEIHRLIFEPGFSTAEKVTEFSGRGVGMDVVRKQVERLRGRVEIRSVHGKGTAFIVRVPLTLAMVDGLLVRVNAERYVLPTFLVREIFRAQPGSIYTIGGRSEMVKFRETTIPVVRLADRLQPGATVAEDAISIMIVVQNGPKQVCLVADEVIGKQEVVIKSLGSCFRNQVGIAGGAILGDGRVGLILDLDGLLQTRIQGASIEVGI